MHVTGSADSLQLQQVAPEANSKRATPTEPNLGISGSDGVVNSLDFYLASLKSPDRFYFRCVLSSQWKAVPVNLQVYSASFRGILCI